MVCIQSNGVYTINWYVYSQMVCIQSNGVYTVKWYLYSQMACMQSHGMHESVFPLNALSHTSLEINTTNPLIGFY